MYAYVNGVNLYFDVVGAGTTAVSGALDEKPVMFALHGGPGCDHTYYRPWLDPLGEQVQLVFLDHRGNGRSERTDTSSYTIEQMADDVEGLRNYLGMDKVIVHGHSFGGMVAQVYALRHPNPSNP